ncbi:MAG: ATP-binding protein [Deltaproteobacteria bacterium]|nr:ATP-binding protein [Deltaproteobacteria bacterium]
MPCDPRHFVRSLLNRALRAGPLSSAQTLNVLLVEDDESYADTVGVALANVEPGVVVHRVVSLKAALERLAAGDVDLVLLDLSLSDAELQGVRRIHAAAPFVPLVVLAGSVDDRLATRALAEGAHDYLLKDEADAAMLARTIRSARQRHRFLAGLRARTAGEVHRRALFLAKVSQLFNGSLDVEATMSALAIAPLPELAEWCVVQMRDEGSEGSGVTHQMTSADVLRRSMHVSEVPTAADEADGDAHGLDLATVLQSGERGICPTTTDGHELAALVVPITLRGRILGAVKMGRSTSPYTEDDLNLAEELARRAGPALENARLYRVAREAIALRDEFLSIASHELRTPLTSLYLQLIMLQRMFRAGPVAPAAGEPRVASALRQVGRLTQLTSTLFDVTRITAGQLTLEARRCDLAVLAQDAARQYREEANARCGPLLLTSAGSVVGAWDPQRIEQVLANLLGNAAKYGDGKPVLLSVLLEDGWAVLRVQDAGIGIAAENVARIFGRFERAVSGTTYSGLGLGLYVSRQIVVAHGGSIDCASTIGEGSIFTVRLPIDTPFPTMAAQA